MKCPLLHNQYTLFMNKTGFVQWYCRGLPQNIRRLLFFSLDELHPIAAYLQKTHLYRTHTDIVSDHRVSKKKVAQQPNPLVVLPWSYGQA